MGTPPQWKDAVGRAFQREFATKETNMPTGIPPLYEVQELPAMPRHLSQADAEAATNAMLDTMFRADPTHFQFLSDIPEEHHHAIRYAMAQHARDYTMRNRGLEADMRGMCHALDTEKERVKVLAKELDEARAHANEKNRQHHRTIGILATALRDNAPEAFDKLCMAVLKN